MGCPLGKFEMLAELKEKMRSNKEWAKKALGQFKLFAVVMHNPADERISRVLNEQFEELDMQTGPRLLFISFINPPERWAKRFGEEREYYCFDKQALSKNIDHIPEPALWHRNLKRQLGIDPECSVILLTDDLLSDRYYCIQTSAETVTQQLWDIGLFCFHLRDDQSVDFESDKFHNLLQELNATHQKAEQKIIDTFLDMLSVTPCNDDSRRRERTERAETFLGKLKMALMDKLQGNETLEDEDYFSYYDMRCMLEISSQAQLRMQYNIRPHVFAPPAVLNRFCIPGAENDSNQYLRTFGILLSCMQPDSFNRDESMLDMSALVVYLAKVLELEGNMSFVQLCRKLKGIEMPEFFDKYCPRVHGATVEVDGHTIYINNKIRRDQPILQHLTLGNVLDVYRYLTSRNDSGLEQDHTDDQDRWKTILDIRNRAAHTTCSHKEFDIVRDCFRFLRQTCLPRMIEIKQQLRDGTHQEQEIDQ